MIYIMYHISDCICIYIYMHWTKHIYIYIIILKPMYTCTMRTCSRIFKLSCLICLPFRFLRSASLSLHYYVHIYIYLTPLEMHMHSLAYVIWLNALWICLPGRTIFLSPGSYWMAFRDLLQGYFRCCLRHLKSRISIRSSDTRFTSNN